MKYLFRTLIVLVACAPFVWLSWLSASPNGERTVSWIPGEFSSFITSPLPGDRVSDVQNNDQGSYVELTGEPTYVAVFPPSDDMTSATVTVEFDPKNAFAFELGGLTNIAAYAFDFRPLSNAVVESLSWFRLSSSNPELPKVFSKTASTQSAESLIASPPTRTSMVTYRASLPGAYREASYTPLSSDQRFDVSLRGSHEYLTYIKNETFRLSVTYQDVNRTFGEDAGYVRVYNENGNVMTSDDIVDDGNTSEDQTYSTRTLSLSGASWPEGVYRVELSGTSDIVWRTFVTSQRYMAFKNHVFIGDDVGYLEHDRQTTFVTNSKSLAFETLHANSAHGVDIGKEHVDLPLAHTIVRTTVTEDGAVAGKTDAGDVKMSGEGKFAFSQGAFFDPDPRSLTVSTALSDTSLRYLVANVPDVQTTDNGWRTASATFDLSSLVKESGAYKFALSLPGQAVDGESILLHRISVTFTKPKISLGVAVWNELRRWRQAVRDRLEL